MNDNVIKYLDQIREKFDNKVSYISLVKTGKEAVVHLISIDDELCALKIYKEDTKFSTRNDYFQMQEIGDKRLIRAVKKKSKAGVRTVSNMWSNREFEILDQLSRIGTLVPQPYLKLENAILMEYLGDIEKPAPRLVDVHLDIRKKREVYDIVMDHIRIFKSIGFAHGDLSPYNILWFKEMPYIIDFPQVVYTNNPNFYDAFERDIERMNKYIGQ